MSTIIADLVLFKTLHTYLLGVREADPVLLVFFALIAAAVVAIFAVLAIEVQAHRARKEQDRLDELPSDPAQVEKFMAFIKSSTTTTQ